MDMYEYIYTCVYVCIYIRICKCKYTSENGKNSQSKQTQGKIYIYILFYIYLYKYTYIYAYMVSTSSVKTGSMSSYISDDTSVPDYSCVQCNTERVFSFAGLTLSDLHKFLLKGVKVC